MPRPAADGRFPGYDVLAKRHTPSWNEQTRRVIDARLSVAREPRFFTEHEYLTVEALADRLVPQPHDRPPIPVAALVDHKLLCNITDGYRQKGMPREQEAWHRGLRALDAEARRLGGTEFRHLPAHEQDLLLGRMQRGALEDAAWEGMPPAGFFKQRLGRDIVMAYYSHPTAWNEIGWGGPASPRGYVRMDYDERDPWEAAEVKGGDAAAARRHNAHVGG